MKCLLCNHSLADHTTGRFCDYDMAPGDRPDKYTPSWHDGNPYAMNPELAKEWEHEYWRTLNNLNMGDNHV